MSNNTTVSEETIKYSKLLSSLFSSSAIIALSILCLLNNLSLDIYSACMLLKTVIPAALCFWFIGFVIGRILDSFSEKIITKKIKEEEKAYEIPSIFSADDDSGMLSSDFDMDNKNGTGEL